MDDHSYHNEKSGNTVGRWIFIAFALVAGFFLLTEHRAHLFGVLPFLFLAACPLMHLFHHHGGHSHRSHDERKSDRNDSVDSISDSK